MDDSKIRSEQADRLMKAVLTLETVEDAYRFFEDLCTNKEIRDMGQRLTIAKLLREGSSYLNAAEKTGVSSATVGRVKRCLDYGDGGYDLILGRMGTDPGGNENGES